MSFEIKVGVSARHIHLCEADFKKLFGNADFFSIKDLNQGGEFASNLTVSVKTKKGIINNLRVVGPLRDKTQVEISKSDAYLLEINPPIRMSGDLDNSESVILCKNDIEIDSINSCIIANRHIHINNNDALKYGLKDGDEVSVIINGDRSAVLNKVFVKVKDNYNLELHLDTDEANAVGVKNGDIVEVRF